MGTDVAVDESAILLVLLQGFDKESSAAVAAFYKSFVAVNTVGLFIEVLNLFERPVLQFFSHHA